MEMAGILFQGCGRYILNKLLRVVFAVAAYGLSSERVKRLRKTAGRSN